MCGIVGLFLKDPALESELGSMLADMLEELGDRGPDSTGVAVYGRETPGRWKLTVRLPADLTGPDLAAALGEALARGPRSRRHQHAGPRAGRPSRSRRGGAASRQLSPGDDAGGPGHRAGLRQEPSAQSRARGSGRSDYRGGGDGRRPRRRHGLDSRADQALIDLR